jgi:hypothetical protein
VVSRLRSSGCRGAGALLAWAAVAFAGPLVADSVYDGTMTGDVISPPVSTTATGTIGVWLHDHVLELDLAFSGLSSISTGGHIHCCADLPTTAGVAILLPSFPLGVTSAVYPVDLALDSAATYQATFLNNFGGGTAAGAEAALIDGFRRQRAYFCVHSTTYPASELRAYPDWVSFEDGFESGGVAEWTSAVGYEP